MSIVCSEMFYQCSVYGQLGKSALFVAVSCIEILFSQGGVQSKAQTDREEGRTEESFDGK